MKFSEYITGMFYRLYTFRLKNTPSPNGLIVGLTLTNIDLDLFFEQYNVYNLRYESGWKFKGIKGLFCDYIDKWIEEKNQGTIAGNKGRRSIAKLQLNSLYGKFAKQISLKSQLPFIDDEGVVHYATTLEKDSKPLYLPVAIFTTSYRKKSDHKDVSGYNRLFT